MQIGVVHPASSLRPPCDRRAVPKRGRPTPLERVGRSSFPAPPTPPSIRERAFLLAPMRIPGVAQRMVISATFAPPRRHAAGAPPDGSRNHGDDRSSIGRLALRDAPCLFYGRRSAPCKRSICGPALKPRSWAVTCSGAYRSVSWPPRCPVGERTPPIVPGYDLVAPFALAAFLGVWEQPRGRG